MEYLRIDMMTSNTGIVIATAGDVLLKVGAENKERKLLVSCDVLRSSSFYFKALTGSSFQEGQVTRSSQSPQVIILQEDDAQSVEDLCLLLHGQEPTKFRTGLTKETSEDKVVEVVNRLLSLAVAIDKYGCVEQLRLQTSGILFELFETLSQQPKPEKWLSQVVTACYLLDNKHGFRISTQRLTKETTGFSSDEVWPEGIPSSTMPDKIKDAIDAKRDRAAVLFATELRPQLAMICVSACDSCREYVDETFEWEFDWSKGRGYRNSVMRAMEVAREIAAEVQSQCHGRNTIDMPEVLDGLESVFKQVDEACVGLCLKCVRVGNSLRGKCDRADH